MVGAFLGDYSNEAYAETELTAVPTDFDARQKWPKYVHPIRDQGGCGSCWAFAASEAFSDRLAIASNGKANFVLSAEDLVSCDKGNGGCQGGWADEAFRYIESNGLVTDNCFPYTAGGGKAPACRANCVDGSPFKKYKCVKGSIVHPTTREATKSELFNNGPLDGGFTVYQDFFSYKSGVYHHVSGGVAGGHAIKVIGYGVENGVSYWLCANSWGAGWGNQGFFKIKMGDSDIDGWMYGCKPDVSKLLAEE
jgi:cathepsin B